MYLDSKYDEKLRIRAFRENISKSELMTNAIHQFFDLADLAAVPEIQLIIDNIENIQTNPLLQSEWKRFCMYVKMSQTDNEDT